MGTAASGATLAPPIKRESNGKLLIGKTRRKSFQRKLCADSEIFIFIAGFENRKLIEDQGKQ